MATADNRELTEKFIKESFSPVVAVLTSYEAELVCQKNSLSFCELLAPFSQLSSDAALKDPSNQNHLIKSLRLDFRDLRRDGFLSTNAFPLALTELVGAVPVHVDVASGNGETNDLSRTPQITPWYDQYRKQLTKLLEPSDHEFVRNYVACLLVASVSQADPLDQLTRLSQTQHAFQHQSSASRTSELPHLPKHAAQPKWFSPNIFKFHLLLHDVSTDDEKKAETVYQSMKMTYGAHACHLLRVNSNACNSSEEGADSFAPDPWASYSKHNLRNFDSIRLVAIDAHDDGDNYAKFPLETSAMANFATGVVDAVLPDDGSSGGAYSERAVSPDGSEPTAPPDHPAKVVRSESIPHPLSTNDLTKLADDVGDATVTNNAFPQQCRIESIRREDQTRHGKCLSSTDIDRVKTFVQEFCQRGLLPFVERQLKLLNDQISSRRGLISKSLVSSAKRWFTSGSSPNLPSVAAAATAASPDKAPHGGVFRPQQPTASTYPTYTLESVEMQMRRLADLAFLFQHYEFAYQHYYALKKEFAHTGAWLHQASMAEFASLCVYLSNSSTTAYPNHYIDSALTTYSSICGKPWLAIRATMFGAEILISQNTASAFSEAAGLYIRMTTGDDLSGALFLERAAWCFAKAKLFRKAALHLILAGHRYRKAGLNRHTVRCYELAYVVYEFRSWRFAEDHVRFTLNNNRRKTESDSNAEDCASLVAKIPKLTACCFSSEYLAVALRWTEALAVALAKKPLPSGLSPKPGYRYAPLDTTSRNTRDIRNAAGSGVVLNGESNLYSDLVSCRLNCHSTMTHDFESSSLCYVPVQLSLFNGHPTRRAKLTLKFFGAANQIYPDSSKSYQQQQQICQPLCWTRYSAQSIRLKPNDSKTVDLSGYCTLPGVYDCSSLRVAYRLLDDKENDNGESEAELPSHFVTVRQVDCH